VYTLKAIKRSSMPMPLKALKHAHAPQGFYSILDLCFTHPGDVLKGYMASFGVRGVEREVIPPKTTKYKNSNINEINIIYTQE
jgi:hypothetical protein